MNLTISKEQIINGLQAVQNVVSTRTTLPILSNVLLRAEDDRLASDRDRPGCDRFLLRGSQGEKARAPPCRSRRLFGIVRELNNLEIDMEVDDKHVCTIRSGSSFFRINGLSADEFPPMPDFKDDKKVSAAGNPAGHDEENFLRDFHG